MIVDTVVMRPSRAFSGPFPRYVPRNNPSSLAWRQILILPGVVCALTCTVYEILDRCVTSQHTTETGAKQSDRHRLWQLALPWHQPWPTHLSSCHGEGYEYSNTTHCSFYFMQQLFSPHHYEVLSVQCGVNVFEIRLQTWVRCCEYPADAPNHSLQCVQRPPCYPAKGEQHRSIL